MNLQDARCNNKDNVNDWLGSEDEDWMEPDKDHFHSQPLVSAGFDLVNVSTVWLFCHLIGPARYGN